jgi:uncharacterized repeat protein (TIGR01451 family)
VTQSLALPSRLLGSMLVVFAALLFTAEQPAAAQTGADLAASISGNPRVRIGQNITYTVAATNVGDETATGVQIVGWVPDWFNFVSKDCLSGTPSGDVYGCSYPDLAPGASVSMTITVNAVAPEPNMFELGFVSASNDTNIANDQAQIKVNITKYSHGGS